VANRDVATATQDLDDLEKRIIILTVRGVEIKAKWANQDYLRQLMKIELDYTKTETISCQLESVFDYLLNYNKSFADKDPEEVL